MRAVVFLGPSLPHSEAIKELDAEFLPPVQRGDINALLNRQRPPEVIGIIDGRFLSALSISPKEVLTAIDRGVKVFGSSSMGALRAVECEPWGMVGIGKIFEEYRSGRIDADDEVAIVYDEETGAPLSEPMINLRFAIDAAITRGIIKPDTGQTFLSAAKSVYFPQRTIPNIMAVIANRVPATEHQTLTQFFATEAPDTKADDARELLRAMRSYLTEHDERPIERRVGVHLGGPTTPL